METDVVETFYAVLLGLFLMKLEIPPELVEFVRENQLDLSQDMHMVFKLITNADSLEDPILYSMVLKSL